MKKLAKKATKKPVRKPKPRRNPESFDSKLKDLREWVEDRVIDPPVLHMEVNHGVFETKCDELLFIAWRDIKAKYTAPPRYILGKGLITLDLAILLENKDPGFLLRWCFDEDGDLRRPSLPGCKEYVKYNAASNQDFDF